MPGPSGSRRRDRAARCLAACVLLLAAAMTAAAAWQIAARGAGFF